MVTFQDLRAAADPPARGVRSTVGKFVRPSGDSGSSRPSTQARAPHSALARQGAVTSGPGFSSVDKPPGDRRSEHNFSLARRPLAEPRRSRAGPRPAVRTLRGASTRLASAPARRAAALGWFPGSCEEKGAARAPAPLCSAVRARAVTGSPLALAREAARRRALQDENGKGAHPEEGAT